MEFFEMRVFFGGKIKNVKNVYKKCANLEGKRDFPICAPVSSSQRTQSDACRLKTVIVGF